MCIFKSLKTLKPLEEQLPKISGVYLIELNGKIEYVGKTICLRDRLSSHLFLKDYPNIKFVYFYEEKDIDKLLLIEAVYKFRYLGRNRIGDRYSWNDNYNENILNYKCDKMQSEFDKKLGLIPNQETKLIV
mgnify:CR=1 FL=1